MPRQAVAVDFGDTGQTGHRNPQRLAHALRLENTLLVCDRVEEGVRHSGLVCASGALYAH